MNNSALKHMLTASHLKKTINKRAIVRDVSFYLSSGEVVGLLGPNGAGKTTSFYMMVGLLPPDQGSIQLDDTDLTQSPIHTRAKLGIAYLPQEASIFRRLSVSENIFAALEQRQELNATQKKQALQALLEEFRISHLANNEGISLSGGERRRVEIARTLALNPRFILLDEPFAGVDPLSVVDLKQIIQSLQAKQIGILITDHNVRETLSCCDRAYIVHNGEIICHGDKETILKDSKVRAVYLGNEFDL